MRILVTGAEGLVGSAVVPHLREHGMSVVTLEGDARDPDGVAAAVGGVDGVVHLAAHRSPYDHPAPEVFGNNALATFTVLWTAAEAGVRRFAIASSVNATGLPMNPEHPLPQRFPVSEEQPPDLADPYSLSKATDEATLRTVCRRFGASGVALRLPLVVAAGEAERRDLGRWGAADGWAWIDARDAAEAFRLALVREYEGAHVLLVAAADTLEQRPTAELLATVPEVPCDGAWPGRLAPVDTRRARELLGFGPRYAVEGLAGRSSST